LTGVRLLPLPGVFQPISDSRWLADKVAREAIGPGSSALDVCTGSGILAVTAALTGASVTAVDVSRRAVLSARLNAALNGVKVRALRGDLFQPVAQQRFDLIVSNPPYVPSRAPELPRRGRERAWDAGPRGRVFLDRICAQAGEHLNPGGVVLIVQNAIAGEQETVDALSGSGLATEVVFRDRGSLGPLLSARRQWLLAEGLLTDAHDEVLIVRAQAGSDYQCTPRIRCASATCSVEARSSGSFSPRAAAESGNTL
jgi:release factor glutamine methyltransferase